MKLLYILSMGHSGSTLMDSILGTHPQIQSSGELRYLNWQLWRTMHKKPSVADGDICSCEQDFRECAYWSKVFQLIQDKTGANIVTDPLSFDTAYFGQFAYANRGGFQPSYWQRLQATFFRRYLERGWPVSNIKWLAPQLDSWLTNNWLLYESMAEASNSKVVVDSSKHLLIALLLQQYRPESVTFLFIHRSIEGLVSSAKRWSNKRNVAFDIKKVVKAKQLYEQRVAKYKQNIPNLHYIDTDYEQFVATPATFLRSLSETLGLGTGGLVGNDKEFFIDPSQQHIVAGNPMRYRGKQQVIYDDRWKEELSKAELKDIQTLIHS